MLVRSPPISRGPHHAHQRRKRPVHAHRTRHPDGQRTAPLLARRRLLRYGDRQAATREGARRRAGALSLGRRRTGADGVALRASARCARSRPRRGRLYPLPVSRLALRRGGSMYRAAGRTGRQFVQRQGSARELSHPGIQRHRVRLHGPGTGAAAAAVRRATHDGRRQRSDDADRAHQLARTHRKRRRHQPSRVASRLYVPGLRCAQAQLPLGPQAVRRRQRDADRRQ